MTERVSVRAKRDEIVENDDFKNLLRPSVSLETNARRRENPHRGIEK